MAAMKVARSNAGDAAAGVCVVPLPGSSEVLMLTIASLLALPVAVLLRPEDRRMAWTLPFPPDPRKPQAVPIGKHMRPGTTRRKLPAGTAAGQSLK
jgi:hypothetical protein